MLLKYNPKRVTLSFTGTLPSGKNFAVQFEAFMDGTMIEAEFDVDQVTKHVGGDGVATATLSANRGVKVTATLLQGSPTNDDLTLLIPNADLNYLPVGVLTLRDLNGTSKLVVKNAWIVKPPKIEYAVAVTGRPWMFDCEKADAYQVGSAGEF